MKFKSVRKAVYIIISMIIMILYSIRLVDSRAIEYQNTTEWSRVMLYYFGIAAVFYIISQIALHVVYTIKLSFLDANRNSDQAQRIVNAELTEDEMDKTIYLKSEVISAFVVGSGFLIALLALAIGKTVFLAFNIQYYAFYISVIVESSISIYLYERGI